MVVFVSLVACLLGAGGGATAAVFFFEFVDPGFCAGGGVEAAELVEGGAEDVAAGCSCGVSGFAGGGVGFGIRNCITAMPIKTSRKASSSFFSPPDSFLGS